MRKQHEKRLINNNQKKSETLKSKSKNKQKTSVSNQQTRTPSQPIIQAGTAMNCIPQDNGNMKPNICDNPELIDSENEEGGEIKISTDNIVMGKLKDQKNILILIDSGSSQSLISETIVDNHSCLNQIERQLLKEPMTLMIANGDVVKATHAITFAVYVQGIKVMVTALIMGQEFGAIGLVLGNNDLNAHKAVLDFAEHKITFRRRNIQNCMKLKFDEILHPNQTKRAYLYGKVQKPLKGADVILKATGIGKKHMLAMQCVRMRGNSCIVLLINDTNKKLKFHKGTIMANLDMMSSFAVRDPVIKIDMQPEHTIMYVQREHGYEPTPVERKITSNNLKIYKKR